MTSPRDPLIRDLDARSAPEVALVAERMRLTLIEVLGEERGRALYTLDWLRDRVRWHLDPACCTGKVLLAESQAEGVVGHTILRLEEDDGGRFGLFSTIYVAPQSRGRGVATELLRRGERWFVSHDMPEAATNTAEGNERLIRLFEAQGYRITARYPDARMVRLAKTLR